MVNHNLSSNPASVLRVGIVGLGYWGPKVLRNFLEMPNVMVTAVCDQDENRLSKVRSPGILKTKKIEDLLKSPDVDAVVLCIPIKAHYAVSKMALEAGKHVWVEKPLADSAEKALELCLLANDKGRVLFVDHTFLYNPAVRKMKDIIDQKLLGDIYYFDSTRINLGLFQCDTNVVWDLAPHDISILNYLINSDPVEVAATGASIFTPDREEIAYVHLYYDNGMIAHFNFNWISPVKIRKIMIGGSRQLLLYDDMEGAEKIKIYDKGIHVNKGLADNGKDRFLVNYRMGDMQAPYVEITESLSLACQDFVNSVHHHQDPISDGINGFRVVRVIEAIQASLRKRGERVPLAHFQRLSEHLTSRQPKQM